MCKMTAFETLNFVFEMRVNECNKIRFSAMRFGYEPLQHSRFRMYTLQGKYMRFVFTLHAFIAFISQLPVIIVVSLHDKTVST